ncbi:amidohydrolase family protein [Halioxenophilus sp. WMMB6]|uniref:metal-dependent hydrolase family protein n=1 Tax=Halioxenophilus sp. WMMB6 TaxID=3073815 RepID=UPI00295E3EE7|nr:amidohydrolase family protein [Halioxenophilus sp. WMMB6]
MNTTLITNANIFDGTGQGPFAGDLLIEGNVIKSITPAGQLADTKADITIDAAGKFLMPGMTEGHAHLSFDAFTCTEDLISPSPEAHAYLTARVAKNLLDHGFTSAYGASEAKLRLGIAVRDEINAGRLPGPRVRAGSLEITVTGGMGDESRLHNPRPAESPSIVVDGPEEMRKWVRICCREGCDNIKLDASGDPFYPNTPAHSTPMSLEEMQMAVKTAHAFGKMVNVHARSIESIQNCVIAGVDMIYHAEITDEKTLDMLEEAKDRIFVGPTIGLFHTMLHEGEPHGLPRVVSEAMGIPQMIESSVQTHTELRKRGVRHVIGGDYGFTWNMQGTQARDLQYFVDYYDYSPAEALVCATKNGGLAMRAQGDLGTLQAGMLADMVLVDGDPLQDLGILTDKAKLVMVMKDGTIHSMAPALSA